MTVLVLAGGSIRCDRVYETETVSSRLQVDGLICAENEPGFYNKPCCVCRYYACSFKNNNRLSTAFGQQYKGPKNRLEDPQQNSADLYDNFGGLGL